MQLNDGNLTAASTHNPPALAISNLAKTYKGNEQALQQINLNLNQGEVVGLIGPSGSGKSTLIRCINRLIEPSAGSIRLNGISINTAKGRQLRQIRCKIGMIFQEYALVERLTVMENLLSGRLGSTGFFSSWFRRFSSQDINRAFELLDRVGLTGMENKRADGLSGGQRQRVGIARALMQNPQLLLVDEPTASLDPKTARQIMRLIVELCTDQGLTAIINIHDVLLATEFLPRIIGLRNGMMVYDGSAQEIDEKVLNQIYGEENWRSVIERINAQSGQKCSDEKPLSPVEVIAAQ